MKTKITRLVLQGFKSFNKRIAIPLDSGFNVIAGPNASGKSNIVDAICFVLGRTSAKSLRANRLSELIFHGSKNRKPAQYASVTMYLDNSQKIFPFEDSEVSITRKVNRSGVSIYKINGRTTTREKVLQLLSAARIHPEGHNIVLQGDVTQIIEMNPIERRSVIDEISGIAEYNEKKNKAQRDLDAVDQKLKEAEIIITQRYEIFKKLENERNAAIKYQNLQKQLQVLKASYAHKKLTTIESQIKKIEEKLEKKLEQNERLKAQISEVEGELDERESAIRNIANRLVNISKTVQMEKEVSELRSKLLIAKDKMNSNLREIERLQNLIEKLEALEARKKEFAVGVPTPVKAILNLHLKGVYGTVAELIKVPEKYRIAVEVAAGPHLYDLVVEDDAVAAYCIDYLKKERIGRATFLPLNKIRPILFHRVELLSKHGVIGVASKLIKYDTKFMSAMEFVFGRTLIVKDLEIARSLGIGKVRMVTLDGDLVERSGVMIGGYYIKTHPKVVETATRREIEKYRETKIQLQQDVNILKDEIKELEKKLQKYKVSESAKELIELEKMRVTSERKIDELRAKRQKLHTLRVNVEIEINRLNIQKAKLETELEAVKEEVKKYGEVHYVDEKLKTLEEFIKRTEKELASIGPVNLRAIDEYEEFKEKFEGYKEKYEKILEEKNAVLNMIEKIEEKRKEVFYKCLQAVSSEFNKMFYIMTRGTAELSLEDPNNLESGLIIKASPKGKKLLNIDAMSGGEKSLTALAFVFAIQRYKPAPFYILDEVDAALDKENSIKVAELIRKLSRNSQFLVITHNDQTIKYGDRVYGCSMIDGESKIIGLELPKR